MTVKTNGLVQILALALQVLNQILDQVPPRAKFWVMLAISALQVVISILAHFQNPDGTSAKASWKP